MGEGCCWQREQQADRPQGHAVSETRDCWGPGAFSPLLTWGAQNRSLRFGLHSFQNLLMISFLPFPHSSSFLPFLLCLFLFLFSEESSGCKEEGRCTASRLFHRHACEFPRSALRQSLKETQFQVAKVRASEPERMSF